MQIEFFVRNRGQLSKSPSTSPNWILLETDNWNDFSYSTLFNMQYYIGDGAFFNIGQIKIGYKGQTTSTPTRIVIPRDFTDLDSNFYSLGQDVEFYSNLYKLDRNTRNSILQALRDIVMDPHIYEENKSEPSLQISLMRNVSLSSIQLQFPRALSGGAPLTDYSFRFNTNQSEAQPPLSLSFSVTQGSEPSTNIHAIIGRNGTGKTTILNKMIESMISPITSRDAFEHDKNTESITSPFSSIISVSFSAFDQFNRPQERPNDPTTGPGYSHIGLQGPGGKYKDPHLLAIESAQAISRCFSHKQRRELWTELCELLESDVNFSELQLRNFETIYDDLYRIFINEPEIDHYDLTSTFIEKITPLLYQLSSGHAIVILTLANLTASTEERTLILIDEPECHLHPPLLSGYIKALNKLLSHRNGVAILATHSPVVLQEIPRSCIWKIRRSGSIQSICRPQIETFAENIGRITNDIFGLDSERSYYNDLLTKLSSKMQTSDEILNSLSSQVGSDGRTIIRALLAINGKNND